MTLYPLGTRFVIVDQGERPNTYPTNSVLFDYTEKKFYTWNGSSWIESPGGSGATVINDLTDVDTTTVTPVNNDVLTWNNTDSEWVPAAPPGAGGGEVNTAANVGTGGGEIFRDKIGTTINLKTAKAGTNIQISNNADDVTINAAHSHNFSELSGTVTSVQIADQTIVDGDINTNAAIQSTKLKDVRKYQKVEAYGVVNLNAYDIDGDGHFNGIQAYGDIQSADNDSTGYWVRLLSKTAAGEFAGLAHFSDILNSFRRDKSGWVMGKMQTFVSDHPFTNQRFVFGFYDQRALPPDSDTLIGDTQHGFFIAFRSGVDTNYRILHNDGSAAAMVNDDSTLAFPTSSTIHEFEIRLGASAIDWFIRNTGGTVLASGSVTSRIPSTSQKLYFYFGMQGNAKSILLRNAECKTGGH